MHTDRTEVRLRNGRHYYVDTGSLVDHGDSIEFTYTYRRLNKQFRARVPWEAIASVTEEIESVSQ